MSAVERENEALRAMLDRIGAAVGYYFNPSAEECIADGVDAALEALGAAEEECASHRSALDARTRERDEALTALRRVRTPRLDCAPKRLLRATPEAVIAERDAARAEAGTVPRHLWLAMANAQDAFERDDVGTLGTINEDIQGLCDAALAWGRRHATRETALAAHAERLRGALVGVMIADGQDSDPCCCSGWPHATECLTARAALAAAPVTRPIPMILHCPACGQQHVDAPNHAEGWENPPHRSHKCGGCQHVWRPADVATEGVAAIQTTGAADSPLADPSALRAQVERLRGALGTFALHMEGCASLVPDDCGGDAACDCGLDAALASTPASSLAAHDRAVEARVLREAADVVARPGTEIAGIDGRRAQAHRRVFHEWLLLRIRTVGRGEP